MRVVKLFLSALLAGICIGLGGTVFLSLDNKVLGALFFTVGLFTICTMGMHLFTGKVCYVFEKDAAYALDLIPIWVGNLAGTGLLALAERSTRIAPAIVEKAAGLCEEGFNRNSHELGKYLSLFFGVMVFILCGFEHCVANMYYFSVAGMWSGKTLLYLLVMTLGNAVGGVVFPVIRRVITTEAK